MAKGAKNADGDRAATEEDIFKNINSLRESMKLPKLKWKADLATLTEHYAETREFMDIEEHGFITLSKFCFLDRFDGQTTEQLLEAWLADPSKRPVILAPGNYGLVSRVEFQNEEEEDGEPEVVLVVLVVSVYR